jgi:hypothetical protein
MAGTTEDPCGRETAENLARLSFPAGLGPAARARSAASHGSAEPFHQRLGEAVASGVAARIEFPGGTVARLVERVRFRNGTEAVHKVVYVEAEVHAEVLASLVGRALGARVPAVLQAGRREMYMELMTGRPAVEVLWSLAQARPFLESWDGLLLGVLDAAIDNRDRNAGNWIISDGGEIAGIDHAAVRTGEGRPGPVAGTTEPGEGAVRSPFAERWLARRGDGGDPEWIDNVVHPADLDLWIRAVHSLQPHFDQRGYPEWWRAITGRLRAIRTHAKGPQPWLATRTRLNSRSQGPAARPSRRSPSPRRAR